MRQLRTTFVVVAGTDAARVLAALRALANVSVVTTGDGNRDPAADTWRVAQRAGSPYLVADADPLEAVRREWVAFYEGHGVAGGLEVATGETLARLRSETVGLPDYYLVAGAEGLPATERHWWFGVLSGAAPARVLPLPEPVGLTDDELARTARDTLGHLGTGRWWPEPPERLLAGVDRVAPDRVGLPGAGLPGAGLPGAGPPGTGLTTAGGGPVA